MADLAKQFTREQVIDAIEHVEKENIQLRGSTVYLLRYNGKYYPPKDIIRWAAQINNVNPNLFRLNGGANTNDPLMALGFEIVGKDQIKNIADLFYRNIIQKYKELVKNGNKDELYKYHLISQFQNKWDFNSSNFTEMFLSIDFKNLVYHPIALNTLITFAKIEPEFLKNNLKYLFDEDLVLEERIRDFCTILNDKYTELSPGFKGGIDERTVATLLTFFNPSNYTFYKWETYNKWFKSLNRDIAKTGSCYLHYLKEIRFFRDNYIKSDVELTQLHRRNLEESPFKDGEYMVLAQDIIYQTVATEVKPDYESEFKEWLVHNSGDNSNKVSSYTKAIKILSEILYEKLFSINDVEFLEDLYNDLIINQKDSSGRYHYKSSPSYGTNGFFSASIKEYFQFHQSKNVVSNSTMQSPSSLNQILYGPPGTGKTYNTINKAVSIINPGFDLNQERSLVKAEYQRLVDNGQIVFTTFHQSMSYEDFVEGIKPVLEQEDENSQLGYTIEDGIFKSICQTAALRTDKHDGQLDWRTREYFKLSLGGRARPDVHDYCLDNNIIALGYGGEHDLTPLKQLEGNSFKTKFAELNPKEYEASPYAAQAAQTFLRMNVGDVVVVSKGNRIVDAVGIVEGEYYFEENPFIDFKHFRKVKWLGKKLNLNPELLLDVNISQMTIYEFYKHTIKFDAFEELFGEGGGKEIEKKSYVLIIDEINRGNISAIFGELITLIEESKRAGNSEALKVTLPYSKRAFEVPSNLYIIGTMNTADRSVEALDTALRRRFVFEEMLPKYELEGLQSEVFGFPAAQILNKINKRIEKLIDQDHTIGHAYFLDKDEVALMASFYKNIIPLLQEYFFGDYGKIGLVLGAGFVGKLDNEEDVFAAFDYDEGYKEDLSRRQVYHIIDHRKSDRALVDFQNAISLLMQ